jgi:hypothetical protein
MVDDDDALHVNDEGSKSSVLDVGTKGDIAPVIPPVTSTVPFGNSVAVALARAVSIGPLVTDHVAVAGLKISDDAKGAFAAMPPAINTVPFASRVAVAPYLAFARGPVVDHVFAEALYTSEDVSGLPFES